jgi:hypothetical protein
LILLPAPDAIMRIGNSFVEGLLDVAKPSFQKRVSKDENYAGQGHGRGGA